MRFVEEMSKVNVGPDSEAFMKGYKNPSAVTLPGYFKTMSDTALMRLAVDQQLSPEQMGALKFMVENRLNKDTLQSVSTFTKVVTEPGVKVTPAPQGFYLNVINQLCDGQCAGITHVLSLAIAKGKQDIFLGNIFQALANPDAPESQVFFKSLAQVQRQTGDPDVAHDPATVRLAPYSEIARQLTDSPTTKTLLISAEGHRISAGVIVDPDKGRTYYYNDPNIGFATFSSKELFKKGLQRIFTHPDLRHLVTRVNNDSENPAFKMSVFNSDHLPIISGQSSAMKYMYDAPLAGLDNIKVVDATRVPTPDSLRALGPTPSAGELADFDSTLKEVGKLHETKGMSQFHKAVDALKATRNFMASHPGSPLLFRMLALESKLIDVINEARPPADYPFAFERMEQQRAYLAEDKLGAKRKEYGKQFQGKDFYIYHHAGTESATLKSVHEAIDKALLKLQQSDPKAASSVGEITNVIIAKPGDQPETHLFLGSPPTLIIGDDFITPPPASGGTVADRLGREAQSKGDDPLAAKQAAMLAGKFGMLGYYKADSTGFLEVASNKEPFRDGGIELGSRATRSSSDFMEQAYTARLHDGRLDAQTSAALGRLFAPAADALPPATTQAPDRQPPTPVVTPPTTAVAPIDPAELRRLQALDANNPLIRIGELEVSRAELYRMGLHIGGKPIESALATDSSGRITSKVEIDYDRLVVYLKSTSPEVGVRTTSIVNEIAAKRSPASGPLATRGEGRLVPEQFQKYLHDTSKHAAAISELQSSGKPLPAGFFAPEETPGRSGGKSKAAGLGFQAFSTFQGLRASIDSFQRGDTTAGAIIAGGVVSDYVGMGVEAGLNKLARTAITQASPTILGFQSSTIGKMIGKVAGGAGAAISVPFDIYNAVDSFKKAAGSTGKEAQDHYVNGAFAVTNAVTSIGLSAAFLAGFSAAGPAGLAVAAILMSAQAIYSAVRTVEEINEYTPLSGTKKFEVGLKSFLGFEPGFEVIKPYLEAKYAKEYDTQKREYHQKFLNGPGKDIFERVVFGSAQVVASQVPGKVGLTGKHWWAPITFLLNLIKVDGKVPSVSIRGGNDRINAPADSWNGMKVKPVDGAQGSGKATLWDLGDGDDQVAGVFSKPNYFMTGGGKKLISGGEVDDTVIFTADARQTLQQAEQVENTQNEKRFSKHATELWGGEGRNTLVFSGSLNTSYTEGKDTKTASYSGHVIDFRTGMVSVNTAKSSKEGVSPIAYFHEFSNAATVENGESYIVGDDQSSLFTLNGKKDVVLTGKGSNVVVINGGATVVGEGGPNTYIVNKSNKGVTIKDPNDSVIKLDYSAAQVSGWSVSPTGDLTVNLKGDEPGSERKLVIQNAFSSNSTGDKARPAFITNDGVMLAISAPRQPGSGKRVVQVNSVKVEVPKTQA
ncbi:hypothetical protein LVW35_15730 [Pseudomonas sp. HN11]|uniref:hypothetical protein n=1 Tax=Pseudomonas sp. HN11 TaxID=1344094 RepID=UPI001F197A25|nr:hypothetical protein [Pseudomonas sp. HN11]UII69139.1 hypothetical protein LVW35_15730 [Pseudomonas sp. HN11]